VIPATPDPGRPPLPATSSATPPAAEETEGRADRIAGILLGIAAGDRIGGPIRMALECAESLAHQGAFAPADLGARYLRWWEAGGFDTGPTAERVFGLASRVRRTGAAIGASAPSASAPPASRLPDLARRVDRERSGLTAGCNPAHRAAPLAMLAALPDAELAAAARTEAALTHAHPLAGDVSAAVVVLARALVRGTDWPSAVAQASAGRLPETRQAILRSGAHPQADGARQPGPHPPSRGGFAPEVLHAALATLHAAPDFDTAMERALALAGPANYAPVLVGSLGGARWGRGAVSEERLRLHAGLRRRIEVVTRNLMPGWALKG
jgi:ADP-ribosylglycohydrolase